MGEVGRRDSADIIAEAELGLAITLRIVYPQRFFQIL
jgi:hypothetical protein